jgi:hypothetical protein
MKALLFVLSSDATPPTACIIAAIKGASQPYSFENSTALADSQARSLS